MNFHRVFRHSETGLCKGHGSLLAEAYSLVLSPLKGGVLLFVGRDERKMKVIYLYPTGLWVSYKVFHQSAMKSLIEFTSGPLRHSITVAEVSVLLEGSAFTAHKRVTDR